MKFRTIYDEERPSPKLKFEDETLCLQYQVSETSIEQLVRLANQNVHYLNEFNSGLDREPVYCEVSPVDFQDALEVIAQGQEAFFNLPPQVRVRFSNPVEFLTWLEDPSNYDEAEKLGLLDPEKVAKRRESLKKEVATEPVSE